MFITVMTYILALYFAIGWTLGVIFQNQTRTSSNITAIFYWWIEIIITTAGYINSLHLFWLMPLTLFLSVMFIRKTLPAPFSIYVLANIILSSIFLIPILLILIFYK